MLEERFGPLRGRAWYLSEFVAGDDAGTLCGQNTLDQAGIEAAGLQVTGLLAQLAHSGISHGDMKATNFILAEQGAVVIDLDAMQEHVVPSGFRRAHHRDLTRFMRNWETCPEIKAMFTEMMGKEKRVTDI